MLNHEEYEIEEILNPHRMDFSEIDKSFAERLKHMFLEAAEKNREGRQLSDDELEQVAAAGSENCLCRRLKLPDTEEEKN